MNMKMQTMADISFSLITNNAGNLTKTIKPDGNGSIVKEPAAQMITGMSELVEMPFKDFGPFLRTLKSSNAICHGVTGHIDAVGVVTASSVSGQLGKIARTKEYFYYSEGTGLGMFDHDPKLGQNTLNPEEFLNIIYSVCPDFRSLPTWWTPSTSSCIYDDHGRKLTVTNNGWHMYFPFTPARRLPDFANWLFKKFWIAGHGYIFVSRAGSLLTRTIFDASVFSPERLDFVAGAHCIDCEQRLPNPVYREGLEVTA